MRKFLLTGLVAVFIGGYQATNTPPKKEVGLENLVVLIRLEQHGLPAGSGSGVIIDSVKKGERFENAVLTAKHVVGACTIPGFKVFIDLPGKTYTIEAAFLHTKKDVGVVTFSSKDALPFMQIRKGPPKPLEEAYAAGFPMGMGLIVTEGLINYKVTNIPNGDHLWFCSAPVYSGNSGGAVISRDTHELIGITLMVGSHPNGPVITVVPHTQIFIPISDISDWIKEVEGERQKIK